MKSGEDRRADPDAQTHVVIERQPRHHRGVRRGDVPGVREVADITCSKLATRLRCETITPAGWRVEPDVYCRYAILGSAIAPDERGRAVQVEGIDLDERRGGSAVAPLQIVVTSPDTADVVRTAEGDDPPAPN